jgi:poly(3-hydroxybutyrate) depolymerase
MEVAFIRKALDQVIAGYNVDRTRIVVHGYQGGGVMAYLTALAHRDLIRGAAVVDAALPRMATVPENDPLQRLTVYTTTTDESDLAERIEAGAEGLSQMRYPVTVKQLAGPPRYLNAEELAELVRWIDTLDRL